MKKIIYSCLISFSLVLFTGCNNNNSNTTNNSNIHVNRTSTSISNTTVNDNENPAQNTETNQSETIEQNPPPRAEIYASEFVTPIKTTSQNRATNIQLTCNKLNETIVKAGEEFSFCQKIGVSTAADGYKKADVIVGKKIIQALGGGNCQVSTTLYNAVLGVSELEVTERHPHGKAVNYVSQGKDAAIAHGSKDFRFKNNSNKDLKMYVTSDGRSVYIVLVFLE